MSAKNIVIASIITALLTGCGGGAANQPPALSDDGTYTDSAPISSDDYGSDTSYDPSADTTLPEDSTDTASPDASASPGATTKSYTLMGKVLDAAGKAVVGASVSIGSQTVLTDSSGVYNIPGITDNKVFVSVTKTGFDSISGISVALDVDASTTTTTKSFELAAKDSSSDDVAAGLHHDLTYTAAKFKSVSSMVTLDGNVYVLGVLDGLIFDSTSVVTFSEDGNKIDDFKKIGFLKSLPKDASYLTVSDDQLVVSNASTGYAFSTSGDFAQTVSANKTKGATKVKDTHNGITYELDDSTHVKVTYDGDTTEPLKLDEVGRAVALALDSDYHLLVLDSTNKVVHSFTYEPGDD